MSSTAVQKLVRNSASFKRGAEFVRQEVFGHVPQLNVGSGGKTAKKQFTGPYLAKYYPDSINKFARLVRSIETKQNFNYGCTVLYSNQ
jgi:hypothetical protein